MGSAHTDLVAARIEHCGEGIGEPKHLFVHVANFGGPKRAEPFDLGGETVKMFDVEVEVPTVLARLGFGDRLEEHPRSNAARVNKHEGQQFLVAERRRPEVCEDVDLGLGAINRDPERFQHRYAFPH